MVAGAGAGSDTDTYPLPLNKMLGTKIKGISGYKGARETILAIENGEVDGRCSLKVARPGWLQPGGANLLLQLT